MADPAVKQGPRARPQYTNIHVSQIVHYRLPLAGIVSILHRISGALLFLFVTLGIGVLISTVSQTQGQAIQLAMVVMVPQILLSGFIFPLNAIVPAVRWISYVLPLTYFVPISRGVWVRGATMGSLWENYLVLAGFALVAFTVSVVRFRRDLAAGPPRAGIRRRHAAAPAGPTGQGSA